jgi:hypothetical protein
LVDSSRERSRPEPIRLQPSSAGADAGRPTSERSRPEPHRLQPSSAGADVGLSETSREQSRPEAWAFVAL